MFTYPFKQGKDTLPKLLNFGYWSQHSIWKLLLLLNMRLFNIIGKHCSIENTSHLWDKTEFICNSIVPFMILRGKKMPLGFSRQMCSHHFPSYLSKFHCRGKWLFEKQINYIWAFSLVLLQIL